MESCDKYAGLKSSIKAVYERHKGRYGYRRITAELRQAGQALNHKTVQRLMTDLGLKSLVRPKRYRAYRGESESSPNVLHRHFNATRPNEKWVTDVTEFNVHGAKFYVHYYNHQRIKLKLDGLVPVQYRTQAFSF